MAAITGLKHEEELLWVTLHPGLTWTVPFLTKVMHKSWNTFVCSLSVSIVAKAEKNILFGDFLFI